LAPPKLLLLKAELCETPVVVGVGERRAKKGVKWKKEEKRRGK